MFPKYFLKQRYKLMHGHEMLETQLNALIDRQDIKVQNKRKLIMYK